MFIFQAFDHSFPLRNQMQVPKPSSSSSSSTSTASAVASTSSSSINNQPSTSGSNSSSSTANILASDVSKRNPTTIPNKIEKANEFKTRGNDCVKNGQYVKAVKYYTEAINLNKSEPVFYTNRALCYLKQSQFTECIDDCTKAIGLDAKAVKAYYRRMLAREQMPDGDLKLALADCKMVLQIEPKNIDAQRGLERLQKLMKTTPVTTTTTTTATTKAADEMAITATATTIKREHSANESTVPTQALWSQYDGKNGYERIDFITKAPHLRSKQPLKRIAIGNGEQKITVDSKQSDNVSKTTSTTTTKATPPPTPTTPQLIDQTNATAKSIANQQKPSTATPIDLVMPKNAAQFQRTWSSLSDDSQKFTVLKVRNEFLDFFIDFDKKKRNYFYNILGNYFFLILFCIFRTKF